MKEGEIHIHKMICVQCKKEIPLKKGFSRVWECKDCEVTYYMTYGIN